jgi:ribosomal protein S18 acetylase RimI-like enzyme
MGLFRTPPTQAGIEFRPYRGEADHLTISHFDHMGINILGFTEPPAHLLFAESNGETVGYGRVWLRPRDGEQRFFLDLGVAPAWSQGELEEAILTWQEACAVELALAHPVAAPHALYFFVADRNPGLQKRLEGRSYRAERYDYKLVHSLDEPIALDPLPPGLEIRPLLVAQLPALFDAFASAFGFNPIEDGDRSEAANRQIFEGAQAQLEPSQVAWAGNQVVGAVWNEVNVAEKSGYLSQIHTRPEWRRRGVASALITRSLHHFQQQGLTSATVEVQARNPQALHLYEQLGFRIQERITLYQKPFTVCGRSNNS